MAKWQRLKFEQAERGEPDAVLVRLGGVLDGTPEGHAFLEHVERLARRAPVGVVLDLGGLAHIGSTGVGILAACHKAVVRGGGRLCLTGITQRVEVLFKVSHLFGVIPNAESEEQAIDLVLGRTRRAAEAAFEAPEAFGLPGAHATG